MIPGKIIHFLDRANVGHAGTRDRNLVPHGHSMCGWTLAPDGHTLTILVPEGGRAHLVESLEDNGQVAVTIEEYPAHEAYQFKGRYLRHRPAVPGDVEIARRIREDFMRAVLPIAGEVAVHALRAFVQSPVLAIDVDVREVYVQTPGPGAGARLVPKEA
jgi:hypothetical protein